MLDAFAGVEIANERGGSGGEEGELWWGQGLAEEGWSNGSEGRSLGGDASLLKVSAKEQPLVN